MTRTMARFAYTAAGLLALGGIVLRLIPAPVPSVVVEPPAPFELPAEATGEEQAATLLSFHDIVEGNLFDPSRAAPTERYTPPDLGERQGPTTPTPTEPERTRPALRLFGTAVGPQGSVALIDADPAIPGAEVYRVGDRVRGLQVVEIRDTAVVLEGSTGRFTLSLPTTARRSP